jgi:uncharacterized protein YndB with AHSA1/START domain
MTDTRIATAAVTVEAPPSRVWQALTDPAEIRQYMFGSEVTSDFRVGSEIRYAGEFEGKKYEDHGEILEVIPNEILRSTHFSPLGGAPDIPENYHTITYVLRDVDGSTELTLTQDNNGSDEEAAHSSATWQKMLDALKGVVESGG